MLGEPPQLIVGFDGGPGGRDALALARLLAAALDAQVVAICTWLPEPPRGEEPSSRRDEAEARAVLGELEHLIPEVVSDTRAVRGDAAAVLRSAAEAAPGSALIVLGSGARTPRGRTSAGSTARWLLHTAPCPVAIAPSGFAGRTFARLRRIGIAFDASPAAEQALGWARALAAGQADARVSIDRIEGAEPAPGLRLLSEARDLLVTGSRQLGLLRRLALGSVSRGTLEGASCPVLVVPAGAAAPAAASYAGSVDCA